jgi:hypothetical protein
MLRFVFLLFILTSSATLFAGDRNTAYNLFCKNLSFESERQKCVAVITPFQYFDDRGLKMCAAFTFESEKYKCLSLIGNKFYMDYEMDMCVGMIFMSDKFKCLAEKGQPYKTSCLPREEVYSQIQASLNELRARNYGSVEKRLMYLEAKFSVQCQ